MTKWDRSQPSCPGGCTGEDHLAEMLNRGSDYWHRGLVTESACTDETPHGDRLVAQVRLMQRVQTDERGWYLHPAEVVVVGGGGLLPATARQLATLVAELAAIADDDNSQDQE